MRFHAPRRARTDPPPAGASIGPCRLPAESVKVVCWLSLPVAVLAVIATATGLWWSGGEAPATVDSVRGETIELYGEGLYRYDSVFKGAANRGTDAVMLVAGIPFLLVTALLYRRGSVRGALLLSGALGWCLYLYATISVGTGADNSTRAEARDGREPCGSRGSPNIVWLLVGGSGSGLAPWGYRE